MIFAVFYQKMKNNTDFLKKNGYYPVLDGNVPGEFAAK